MATDLIKYAFVAGELSPAFFGRTDLTKYDLAMAEAYNFFVDYRGGLSSRAGFEFVDYLPDYSEGVDTLELIAPPLLFTYIYDPDPDFNLVGVVCPINAVGTSDFSHSSIRFVKNGKYVCGPSIALSALTLANPGEFTTAVDHEFTTGDTVTFPANPFVNLEWRNRSVSVEVTGAATFTVRSLTDGELIDSTLFPDPAAGFSVARVLEVPCTYEPSQYAEVRFEQFRDLLRITHPAHPIRNLIRSNDPLDGIEDAAGNVWRLEDEQIGVSAFGPTILDVTASATGEAQTLFAVTSVYVDGSESIRGPLFPAVGIVNYPATEGSVSVTWEADPRAIRYNVYRSIVSISEVLTSGSEVGFIGQTKGTKFTDPNIIPDFTRTPPERANPFVSQPIAEVKVLDGGTGYADFETLVTADAAGSGFMGEAIVNDAGEVTGIYITSRGQGYPIGEDQTGILDFAVGETQPSITVYEHVDYGGRSATFNGPVPDLGPYGMEDKISSYRAKGSWTVYEDDNYGGASDTITGNDPDPYPGAPLHDKISSLKPNVTAGSSAVAVATVYPTLGTYPSVSCVFQQRQLYAATYDQPTTLWGSQVKLFSNFDTTPNLVDSDSFEFTLDTPSFSAIRHLIPTQGGLLVTTQESIWVLNGGGPLDPITPTSAIAVPQTYHGVSLLRPIKIGSDLLYAEAKGHAVRMLSYNEISRVYSGDDRSILSGHLFGQNRAITSWAYQESPFKVVWCVQEGGGLLAFTVVKNEDIFAWTPCGTNGQFLAVTNLRENNGIAAGPQVINDRVYVVTQRWLQGRWRRMIERMALRNFVNVEDAMAVDCGVSLEANYCVGNLELWKEDDVWYAKTTTGDLVDVALFLQLHEGEV